MKGSIFPPFGGLFSGFPDATASPSPIAQLGPSEHDLYRSMGLLMATIVAFFYFLKKYPMHTLPILILALTMLFASNPTKNFHQTMAFHVNAVGRGADDGLIMSAVRYFAQHSFADIPVYDYQLFGLVRSVNTGRPICVGVGGEWYGLGEISCLKRIATDIAMSPTFKHHQ